jgi:hypothetical protein
MADLPTDTTSHTTTDTTANTIQNLRQEAFVVLTRGEFQRAIEVLVSFIQIWSGHYLLFSCFRYYLV